MSGYQGLIAALRALKDYLRISDKDLEELGGFTPGHVGKLLAAGSSKNLGPLSMGRMLRALGAELVVVTTREHVVAVRARYAERSESQVRRRENNAIGLSERPAWLFDRKKAREANANRWSRLSDEERGRAAKKAWRTKRRRARQGQSGAN